MKRETEEALEVGFAVVTEAQADGDEKSGAGLPFMERPSGSPSGGARFQIGRCPGLANIASSDPRRGVARR